MKKRTEIQVTSLLGALFLGLLRLPRRVLWDWPKAASARLWRPRGWFSCTAKSSILKVERRP